MGAALQLFATQRPPLSGVALHADTIVIVIATAISVLLNLEQVLLWLILDLTRFVARSARCAVWVDVREVCKPFRLTDLSSAVVLGDEAAVTCSETHIVG